MKCSYEPIDRSMGFPRDFLRERRGIEWQAKNLRQRGGGNSKKKPIPSRHWLLEIRLEKEPKFKKTYIKVLH